VELRLGPGLTRGLYRWVGPLGWPVIHQVSTRRCTSLPTGAPLRDRLDEYPLTGATPAKGAPEEDIQRIVVGCSITMAPPPKGATGAYFETASMNITSAGEPPPSVPTSKRPDRNSLKELRCLKPPQVWHCWWKTPTPRVDTGVNTL
jgi:hypothetical protein